MENKKNVPPLKSIRVKCLECTGGSSKAVKLCPSDGIQSTFCALYPYRFGRRSENSKKRVLTMEQKQEVANRLKKARTDKVKAVKSS